MQYESTAAIDPKRQLYIAAGTEFQGSTFEIKTFSIASGSSYTVTNQALVGCSGLAAYFTSGGAGVDNYPGVVYDPTLDRIVIYPTAPSGSGAR